MQVKIVYSNDSMDSITPIFLKPSCKTVNTSENFLNVYFLPPVRCEMKSQKITAMVIFCDFAWIFAIFYMD